MKDNNNVAIYLFMSVLLVIGYFFWKDSRTPIVNPQPSVTTPIVIYAPTSSGPVIDVVEPPIAQPTATLWLVPTFPPTEVPSATPTMVTGLDSITPEAGFVTPSSGLTNITPQAGTIP